MKLLAEDHCIHSKFGSPKSVGNRRPMTLFHGDYRIFTRVIPIIMRPPFKDIARPLRSNVRTQFKDPVAYGTAGCIYSWDFKSAFDSIRMSRTCVVHGTSSNAARTI